LRKVVLFDIDGTLVLSGGAGRRAMARAFEDLFSVADALRDVPVAGRTDAWIVGEVASRRGFSAGPIERSRFRDRYLLHLAAELEQPGTGVKAVMPGVRELVGALAARPGVFLALLTGNYEQGARAKLEYFDLWHFFRCGAFGDTLTDRNHLVAEAVKQVHACGGPTVEAHDIVVVGDTPHDVACAQAAGARSVAVATGGYDVETLEATGADVVLADFSDLDRSISEILG
jgi:phosphoglycolate phosphatase-like HAD superfamily hydrolase